MLITRNFIKELYYTVFCIGRAKLICSSGMSLYDQLLETFSLKFTFSNRSFLRYLRRIYPYNTVMHCNTDRIRRKKKSRVNDGTGKSRCGVFSRMREIPSCVKEALGNILVFYRRTTNLRIGISMKSQLELTQNYMHGINTTAIIFSYALINIISYIRLLYWIHLNYYRLHLYLFILLQVTFILIHNSYFYRLHLYLFILLQVTFILIS